LIEEADFLGKSRWPLVILKFSIEMINQILVRISSSSAWLLTDAFELLNEGFGWQSNEEQLILQHLIANA
jgi:hypothetical protein